MFGISGIRMGQNQPFRKKSPSFGQDRGTSCRDGERSLKNVFTRSSAKILNHPKNTKATR